MTQPNVQPVLTPESNGEIPNPAYIPLREPLVRVAIRRNANHVTVNSPTPKCCYSKCSVINKEEHQTRQQPGYQKPPETTHYIISSNIEEYQTGINQNGNFKLAGKKYKAEKASCRHILDKRFAFYRAYHRNQRNEGRRLYINQFPPRPENEDRTDAYYSLNYYNNTVDYLHLHIVCEDCYQKARKDPRCFINILTDYGLRYFWKDTIDLNSTISCVTQAEDVLENLQVNLSCFIDDINPTNFAQKIPRIDPTLVHSIKPLENAEYYRQKVKKMTENPEKPDSDSDDEDVIQETQPSKERTFEEAKNEIFEITQSIHMDEDDEDDEDDDSDIDVEEDNSNQPVHTLPTGALHSTESLSTLPVLPEVTDENEIDLSTIREILTNIQSESTPMLEQLGLPSDTSLESIGEAFNQVALENEQLQTFNTTLRENLQTIFGSVHNGLNNNTEANFLDVLNNAVAPVMAEIDPLVLEQAQSVMVNIFGNIRQTNENSHND